MRAEVQKMDWGTLAMLEGHDIMALTQEEAEEVAGGWFWVAAAIAGTAAAGFAAGTFFGWLSRQR